MLFLFLGLTWCVSSVLAYVPPWSPVCTQQAVIPNACVYGNLKITLYRKTLTPKDCSALVEIREFEHTPVIYINSTNTTDRFTVVMVDMGPQGHGPNYLLYMVTNVTAQSLPLYNSIPANNVLSSYNAPMLMHNLYHRTLVQILVFRHHNVLRVPFGELWVRQIRDFSFSKLFSNTSPNLRLCGPVAGTQYWAYDPNYTPSAPPAPPQPGMQPVYIPVVPVVPVGQAPYPGTVPGAPAQAPVPGAPAPAPVPGQPTKFFPKKSSASVSQPMQNLFIPLVILTVMWL